MRKPESDREVFLEIGEAKEFPFKFNLPKNLPTSFEHIEKKSWMDKWWISTRYSIDATLDIPW